MPRSVSLWRVVATFLTVGLVASGALAGGPSAAEGAPVVASPAAPETSTAERSAVTAAAPAVSVTLVAKSLTLPWDVTWVGSTMLINERNGRIWSKRPPRVRERVRITLPRLWTKSEAGLLGMVADPKAASNKIFYACVATETRYGNPLEVRVVRYRLDSPTKATAVGRPLITRIPLVSGRHSGCRLRFGADGKLYVGTGDAARGANPQNKQSLGGKVLRVNSNGSIPADNPYVKLGGNARYVWSYGHRNVQGLALRPGTSQLWSMEQGTYRDDEVNLVRKAGNYGYNPVPGYNESVPMTDTRKYPSAVTARWRSGDPTIAVCGGTFLQGKAWGRWNGALAIAALKGQQIRLLRLNAAGRVVEEARLTAVRKGRIRTVQTGPDGALYFTTSNGSGDTVQKVTPR